jgi:hypothetical protein
MAAKKSSPLFTQNICIKSRDYNSSKFRLIAGVLEANMAAGSAGQNVLPTQHRIYLELRQMVYLGPGSLDCFSFAYESSSNPAQDDWLIQALERASRGVDRESRVGAFSLFLDAFSAAPFMIQLGARDVDKVRHFVCHFASWHPQILINWEIICRADSPDLDSIVILSVGLDFMKWPTQPPISNIQPPISKLRYKLYYLCLTSMS